MSNSVARFIFDNAPCEYTHSAYFLLAYNSDYKVNIVFDNVRDTKLCVDNRITNECLYIDLTKDQITHLLSLDCPDAFIAYALTLCPCPPETSDTALNSADDVDGGILARHALLSETVLGTSEYPLPDCSVCHEPVDIDQFNHNGGACNFCYHELSNDSYDKAIDLERRLL